MDFDDNIESVNVECPPWGGFKTQVIYGESTVTDKTIRYGQSPPIDPNQRLESYAAAIRSAIDLANGTGLLDDPDDTCRWDGSEAFHSEVRAVLSSFGEECTLIFGTPPRHVAAYGRNRGRFASYTDSVAREEAIARFAEEWESCRHLGNVPARRKVNKVPILVNISQFSYPQRREMNYSEAGYTG